MFPLHVIYSGTLHSWHFGSRSFLWQLRSVRFPLSTGEPGNSFFSQARDSVGATSLITIQYSYQYSACQMWFMISKHSERSLLLYFIDVVVRYTFSSFSDTSNFRVGNVLFIQMDRSTWHSEGMHVYGFLYDVSSRFHHRRRDVLLPSQRQVDDYFFQVSPSSWRLCIFSSRCQTVYTALSRQ